jgi:hypothetical protein
MAAVIAAAEEPTVAMIVVAEVAANEAAEAAVAAAAAGIKMTADPHAFRRDESASEFSSYEFRIWSAFEPSFHSNLPPRHHETDCTHRSDSPDDNHWPRLFVSHVPPHPRRTAGKDRPIRHAPLRCR